MRWVSRHCRTSTSSPCTGTGSDFSAAAAGHLKSYLEATYRRYGLSIWVTEYGLMTSPARRTIRWGSTAKMESLPYVERYAWFGLPAEGIGPYRDGRTPTPAAWLYREVGPG